MICPTCDGWQQAEADRIRVLRGDPFEPLPLPDSLRRLVSDPSSCECGWRAESPDTHPHVIGCPGHRSFDYVEAKRGPFDCPTCEDEGKLVVGFRSRPLGLSCKPCPDCQETP